MTRATAIVAFVLAGAACSESPTAPTTTTETAATVTAAQFVGSLGTGASRFYSFTASRSGTVTATLASATVPPFNAAANVALGIGIGRPAGTACPTVTSLTTEAGLTTQLQHGVDQGVYCINVYDPGTLLASVNFVVRFSYP
jgi:hypothetical protein